VPAGRALARCPPISLLHRRSPSRSHLLLVGRRCAPARGTTSRASLGNRASRQKPGLEVTAAPALPPAAPLEASTATETAAALEKRRCLAAGLPLLMANLDLYPPCLPPGQYPSLNAVTSQIRQHSSRINKVARLKAAERQQRKIDRPTGVERSIFAYLQSEVASSPGLRGC